MNNQWLVVLILVIVGVIGLLAFLKLIRWLIHRGFVIADRAPHLKMETLFNSWMNDKDVEVADLVKRKADDESIELLRKELVEIEEQSKTAQNPLIPLRTAIMDAVDYYYLLKGFLEADEQTRHKYYGRELCEDADMAARTGLKYMFMYKILRYYSFLKYNDAIVNEGEDDWFTFYTWIAGNRAKAQKQFYTKEDKLTYGFLFKGYSDHMKGFRKTCLDARPRTPIRGEGPEKEPWLRASIKPEEKPEVPDTPLASSLNDQQVDRLTSLMENRFLKICKGELYVVHNVPPLNPDDAFYLDAGLLLIFLAKNLENPNDCEVYGRRIIESVLRKHKGDLTTEELNKAFNNAWDAVRLYRKTYEENNDLILTISIGAAAVFDIPPDKVYEKGLIAPIVNKIMEDSSDLINEIKYIVRRIQ